jgi:hypothetical protein
VKISTWVTLFAAPSRNLWPPIVFADVGKEGNGIVENPKPPSRTQSDDPISEARERVRQMEKDVEQNKSLLARTRTLIQRLTELLAGRSSH